MTPENKAKVKNELEEKLKGIRSLIDSFKKDAAVAETGNQNSAKATRHTSVKGALLWDAQVQEVWLEETLLNLDRPGFGKCRKCKKEIPAQRLVTMPGASYCAWCG